MYLSIPYCSMQVIANVVQTVEGFLSECASSIMTNDELLRDYLSLRLDSVIRNLEEVMQYVGSHSQLRLRGQAHEYLHRFEHFSSGCGPVYNGSRAFLVDLSYTSILIRWRCCDKWAIHGKKLLLAVPHFGDVCR